MYLGGHVRAKRTKKPIIDHFFNVSSERALMKRTKKIGPEARAVPAAVYSVQRFGDRRKSHRHPNHQVAHDEEQRSRHRNRHQVFSQNSQQDHHRYHLRNRIPTVKFKIPGKAFLKSETRTCVTFKL